MPTVIGVLPLALTFSMSAIQASMLAGGVAGLIPASLRTAGLAHTTLARWMLLGTE